MKKVLIPLLLILLIYIIYKTNDNNLIDYMVIGDSISNGLNSYGNKTYGYNDYIKSYLDNNNMLHKYNDYFIKDKYSIKELISDIDNNKEIIHNDKKYNIRKELREADILTISIGMDELVKILNNDNINKNIDDMVKNMDILLKKITSLSKSKVILIGYYNPNNKYTKETDRFFSYISDKYNSICKKYHVEYIDIYNIIKKNNNYLPNKLDYHLTSNGYLQIAKEVINKSNL